MNKVDSRTTIGLWVIAILAGALIPVLAVGQQAPVPPPPAQAPGNRSVEALGLVRSAMDAYSNLDLQTSKLNLDQALAIAAEIDKPVLARVYVSYGVLWIGGFADNASGQSSFVTAVCLDPFVKIDPMFQSPDIDMLFNMAKTQATPEYCGQVLSTIPAQGQPSNGLPTQPEPVVEQPVPPPTNPCGVHETLEKQKQKYELPFYMEIDPKFQGILARIEVYYAFDSATSYSKIPMKMQGNGYGAMLSCDEGQIRIFDPATISYYIEGYDASGRIVCNHGTGDIPMQILMLPDAEPLPPIGGMEAKECVPCPPWDKSCGKSLPGLGDLCTPRVGCAEGLVCSDNGICEGSDKPEKKEVTGPSHFYFNIGGGTGFGFMTKDMNVYKWDSAAGRLGNQNGAVQGTAWSGIPIRSALGFFIIPDLSLEATARFDVKVDTYKEPKTCWDAKQDMPEGQNPTCRPQVDFNGANADAVESEAKRSAAWDPERNNLVYLNTKYLAWLVNLRVRYKLVTSGPLNVAFLGGIGYGHIKYRITDADGNPYFPMPGMVDIELGIELAYYFTNNVGFYVALPVDVIVGDGFALNADLNIGLSVGF